MHAYRIVAATDTLILHGVQVKTLIYFPGKGGIEEVIYNGTNGPTRHRMSWTTSKREYEEAIRSLSEWYETWVKSTVHGGCRKYHVEEVEFPDDGSVDRIFKLYRILSNPKRHPPLHFQGNRAEKNLRGLLDKLFNTMLN